jgi:hypothetical protein
VGLVEIVAEAAGLVATEAGEPACIQTAGLDVAAALAGIQAAELAGIQAGEQGAIPAAGLVAVGAAEPVCIPAEAWDEAGELAVVEGPGGSEAVSAGVEVAAVEPDGSQAGVAEVRAWSEAGLGLGVVEVGEPGGSRVDRVEPRVEWVLFRVGRVELAVFEGGCLVRRAGCLVDRDGFQAGRDGFRGSLRLRGWGARCRAARRWAGEPRRLRGGPC